jgi:lipopolysaccharide transport system ATP-binding protein
MAQHEGADPEDAPGGEVARLRAVRVCDHRGRASDTVDIRNPMQLEMEFDVLRPNVVYPHFVVWHSEADTAAFTTMDVDPEWWNRKRPLGRYRAKVTLPENLLSEGMYRVVARLKAQGASKQFSEDVVGFLVIDPADGTTARGHWAGSVPGVVRPKLQWKTEYSRILDDAPPVPVG